MRKLWLVLIVCCGSVAYAQTGSQECSSPNQGQGALVGAFRVFNTAEMRYHQTNHRFASMSELVNFDETKKLSANKGYSQPAADSVAIGSPDDPLPGYNVRTSVGDNGKSYTITATKKAAPCAGVGATTDERGVIYFIEPLR
ncbi:MAG: hypothetical protein ACM3JB_00590 [Acidobacteriaceae bacterium]